MSIYVFTVCRGVLLAVFAVSVLSKVRDATAYADFQVAARRLSRVPRRWAPVVAALTVAGEVAVVVGLLIARTAPYAFVLAAALLSVFTVALVRAARSGAVVACRCFGAASSAGHAPAIRNGVLLALSVAGLACAARDEATWRLPPAGLLVCAVNVLVLATALIRFDRLAAALTVHR